MARKKFQVITVLIFPNMKLEQIEVMDSFPGKVVD